MWSSFDEVVRFAAQKEASSVALYEGASKVAETPEAKAMFEELASEERRHRELLERMSKEAVSKYEMREIPDLKISDYLVDVQFSPNMRYDEILILAMKREAKAVELYKGLQTVSDDPALKKLFQALAQEEVKHKLRLEEEYEEHIRPED